MVNQLDIEQSHRLLKKYSRSTSQSTGKYVHFGDRHILPKALPQLIINGQSKSLMNTNVHIVPVEIRGSVKNKTQSEGRWQTGQLPKLNEVIRHGGGGHRL